jgi:hypothetical protein
MAKGKRAKTQNKEEPKEEPSSGEFKETLKTYFDKYGYLAAFAGAVPIISGILLFQEKECGCFLLPKDTLMANNELLGAISIAAGLALALPAIIQQKQAGRKKKFYKIRYEYLVAFLLAAGVAQFYMGLESAPEVETEAGDYDDLAQRLTEKNWILFYGNQCPACHTQFDMLGTSVKYLTLYDCGALQCPDVISVTPTWYNDRTGELRAGVQDRATLEQMTLA